MEVQLQDLFTSVGKYFSYCLWEFPRVQLVLLPLVLSLPAPPQEEPGSGISPNSYQAAAVQLHCSQHPTWYLPGVKPLVKERHHRWHWHGGESPFQGETAPIPVLLWRFAAGALVFIPCSAHTAGELLAPCAMHSASIGDFCSCAKKTCFQEAL